MFPTASPACDDGDIMMFRTQITLDPETQRRAPQRASDLGVSLAEYIRRLVSRDLEGPGVASNPAVPFDLGSSGGSDVAGNKDGMLAALRTEEDFRERGNRGDVAGAKRILKRQGAEMHLRPEMSRLKRSLSNAGTFETRAT